MHAKFPEAVASVKICQFWPLRRTDEHNKSNAIKIMVSVHNPQKLHPNQLSTEQL